MKKQLMSCICGGLFSMLSFNNSFGQEEPFTELPPVTVSATTSREVVSTKVNRAFIRMFKDASHARWYQINEKFMVLFIQNEQENRAVFAKNGQLVYHIAYGTEKNLPTEIRHIVKTKYYDQTITLVLKVNQDDRNIWVISLEDSNDLVMVRVEDMELEETLHFQKPI